ncbi:hypothetical protein BDP27DRAFT_1347336 [Rhodocollybia butyracea]|uniref:Uncharacterized protein n=1 Tax=Rhodocollybia butyracea TaxID=206335 RepID=A0A9P5TXH5_9AGAR|nr:hypothetical protein BDP27DRAFT_1347336 [Rhodocollybia butyracea]
MVAIRVVVSLRVVTKSMYVASFPSALPPRFQLLFFFKVPELEVLLYLVRPPVLHKVLVLVALLIFIRS